MAIPVDTYRLVNLLRERGFTEQQAGGVVEVIQKIDLDALATKGDLKTSELSTKEYVHRELKELELRMTIKLGGVTVAGIGALAVLQLFH
jgi:hypothetical protein